MGAKAYPTPARQRWVVGAQFLDGTFIAGADDQDVIARWHRLSWSFTGTQDEFMQLMVDRAVAVYGCGDPVLFPTATELLDWLDANGVVTLTRK